MGMDGASLPARGIVYRPEWCTFPRVRIRRHTLWAPEFAGLRDRPPSSGRSRTARLPAGDGADGGKVAAGLPGTGGDYRDGLCAVSGGRTEDARTDSERAGRDSNTVLIDSPAVVAIGIRAYFYRCVADRSILRSALTDGEILVGPWPSPNSGKPP